MKTRVSLLNRIWIRIYYLPLLVGLVMILLSIPFLVIWMAVNREAAHDFCDNAMDWMTEKTAEVERVRKRLEEI